MMTMPRDIRVAASLVLSLGLSMGLASAATARDHRPASCPSPKPYAGPALHPSIVIPAIAPAAKGSFDGDTVAALDSAFATAQGATAAPAMTAAVAVAGRGSWARTTSKEGTPLLFWASAGKTLVATVILQLADEGRLSLGDPVSKWVQGVPNGDIVTVRDLLAHTSGLFSANEDMKARAEHRAHTLTEDLRIVARHGAMFCPGERWRYTNSGYALLGAIIDKVEGRPYADAIAERIIKPLGLTHMRVVRVDDQSADVAALISAKERPIAPYWAGAAGPIVASADDMIRFWAALLDGQLARPETVNAMFGRLYPMFDDGTFYGLGVMAFEVPEVDGTKTLWLGHAGGTPGASAIVFYSPADAAFVAVALTGDGSAAAAANLLLRQIRRR